jgi:hypothetical protein
MTGENVMQEIGHFQAVGNECNDQVNRREQNIKMRDKNAECK